VFRLAPRHWCAFDYALSSYRLNPTIELAERAYSIIDQERQGGVVLTVTRYRQRAGRLIEDWTSSDELDSLLRYLHPDTAQALSEPVQRTLYIRLWPAELSEPDPPPGELRGTLARGCLNATLYLGDRPGPSRMIRF